MMTKEEIVTIFKEHYVQGGSTACQDFFPELTAHQIRRLASNNHIQLAVWITEETDSIIRKHYPDGGSKECMELIPGVQAARISSCLLYTSPSPRDKRQSRMPSSA